MRLNEYLKWAENVGDRDFSFASPGIFAFSDAERYKTDGNTHGQASHAIKHLDIFDKKLVEFVIQEFKQILKKYQDKIYLCTSSSCIDITDNLDKYLYRPSILDTLDFVNDKIINGRKLSEIEEKFKVLINILSDKYIKELNKIIDDTSTIKLPNCKSKNYDAGTNATLYIHKVKNSYIVIITSNNKIRTSIQKSNKETLIKYIYSHFNILPDARKILDTV